MSIYNNTFSLRTREKLEIIDVSERVSAIVSDSGIENGLVNVWTVHTTAALAVNENDTSLLEDILSTFTRLIPIESEYHHNLKYKWFSGEQNAHAHILNCLIKSYTAIPLRNKRMALGTWQSILFIELDGPRARSVDIQVMGE